MKAFEMPHFAITLTPAAAMTTSKYLFGTIDSNGALVLPAAGAKAVGVIQENARATEPVGLMVTGVSFVILGATVAAGAEVQCDAAGKAITLAAGKSLGICLVGGDANAIGCVLLK